MPKKITATVGSEERIIVDRFQIDPANFTLSSLPDTSITSPVNGNFLSYYNNNWVNVDAPTARTNLGLGSLATLNSLAFADLTDKPTTITGYGITDALLVDGDFTTAGLMQTNGSGTYSIDASTYLTSVAFADLTDKPTSITGYGITDAVTSVDGSTGAVTTLQLGNSSTTALAGDTVIPDVSDFITATSNETLTNKSIDATQLSGTIDNDRLPAAATNITSLGSLTGLQVGSFSNGPTVMFAMGGTGSEGDAGYVAKGNFTVMQAANLNMVGDNLSFGSNNTMSFGGRAMFQYPVDITADFSQDNTNLFLYATNNSALNSGSSIVFGAKYDSANTSTFLSEGPYIASYKVNATDNDYSFGLKFATIKNGATSQAVAMTIDEDQNVGINGALDVNSDTLRLTETSASLPYPDTGLVPAIELYRNVGSPVDIHSIGHLRFYGNTDSNVKTEYASINVEVRDTDSAFLSPKVHFNVASNDADTSLPIITTAMTLSRSRITCELPLYTTDEISIESFNADADAGPTLLLYRNSPSVADSDVLGKIQFTGRKIVGAGSESNGGSETYAHIQAKVTDKTFDSEDGQLILSTMTAGADTEVLTLSGVGSTFNNQLSVTGDVNIVGSGYSSDLTSSIKPDNTNSSASWLDTGKEFDVDAQEAQINGVWLGDSGTKMYVIGSTSDDLHQYALSTAYDVSTATFTQTNTSGFGGNPQSLWFNNGSDPITIDAVVHNTGQLLVTVDGGSDQLRSYKLSTAWDISTRSASAVTVRDFSTNVDANPTGIAFNNDGSKIILCGSASKVANETDIIYSYNLSSPYDIDTISTSTSGGNNANAPDAKVNLADFSDFIVPVGLPSDIQFSADGTTLYLVCKDRDDVITFTLGTAFDITTMTYNGHLGQFWDDGNLSSVWVDYDNNIALIGGQTNDKVRQYTVDNDALIVDAKNTRFKGSINSHSHGTFEGHMFISGKIVGKSSANFGNITSGGNINFTVGGTGTVKIGGTNQTGVIDIGRTNKTHTLKLASGPTHGILNEGDASEVPAQTKTVEIGMGGLAGSTTNTTIGNPTVGQTNTVTINHSPGVTWTSGSGAPTHSASPGSLYTNTGGGSGTTLYVKESGTDSNGWVGK